MAKHKPNTRLQQSFRRAVERVDFASEFYDRLFTAHPSLRRLFAPDLSVQKKRMVDAIAFVVDNIDEPDALASTLIPLGRRHGPYGAVASQISIVVDIVKELVQEADSELWDDELERNWSRAFDTVAQMFMLGFSQGSAANDSTPEVLMLAQASAAVLSAYSQAQVDQICEAIWRAGFESRVRLAEMAVAETGMGRVDSKIAKNTLATRTVWEDIRDVRTVGIIGESEGVVEIAKPMGVVLAIIPVTNPTSTTLYKILSAVKSRNSIIIVGASRAKGCTNEAARIAYEAARSAGAPQDCIQWVEHPSRELTRQLMTEPDVAIVLATGGPSLVRQAYASGTPAFGVGAGNVPVYIHDSASFDFAAEQIVASKNFDYGTICASEQAIVCTKRVSENVLSAFRGHGAYVLGPEEVAKLRKVAVNARGTMNADIVGKSAKYIAERAEIECPDDVSLLIAPISQVGEEEPLSQEILAPIVAFLVEADHLAALTTVAKLNHYGGVGHTAVIYSNTLESIEQFGEMVTAGRILVNMGSSGGAVGIGSALRPSLTLGCGTAGGNITTANITARDLLNIQRVAMPLDARGAVRGAPENANGALADVRATRHG